MRSSSVVLALAAPFLASAAPAFKRAVTATDILVFQFADVLEQFESGFYQKALSTFVASDFTAAGFTSSQVPIEQFTTIQSDEATHSTVLQAAIQSFGAKPITNCKFSFDSLLTDVSTMAAAARVVENVGVAAYLGAANLLSDPRLLTAAGSILTVEARHQTVLNLFSNTGTVVSSPFDLAFTPSEVLAIVSPFISGCNLTIPSNVPLTVTNNGTVGPGTLVTFQASSVNGTIPNEKLFCQMMIANATSSIPLPLSQCIVPQGINGPVALFITNDAQPLNTDVIDRATVNVVAGPTLVFIDTLPQSINQLVITGQGASNSNSTVSSNPNSNSNSTATVTTTISPAQASQIISGATHGTTTPPSPAPTGTGTSPQPAVVVNPNPNPNPTGTGTPQPAVVVVAPTGTGTPPPPAVVGAATSGGGGSGSGPNTYTGASADRKITVDGWNM